MARIVVTYDEITWVDTDDPDGYEHETGYEDEEGLDVDEMIDEEGDWPANRVEAAVDFLERNYVTEPSGGPGFYPGIWYSDSYETTDYGTGTERQRSFHLKDFTEQEEEGVFQLWSFRQRQARRRGSRPKRIFDFFKRGKLMNLKSWK